MYTYAVTLFCDHMKVTPGEADLSIFTRENLKDWVVESSERWMPNTTRTHFSGVQRFCGWLVDEDYLDADPSLKIPMPVEKESPPEVLSDDELKAILKVCGGKDFLSRRDAAIVRVLLDTGVRASELTGLRVSTTDLDSDMAVVHGKGDKLRPVYFSSKTVGALDRYLRARVGHKHEALDDLWLTQRGGMSAKAVRDRITLIGNLAGVEGLHPHRFRHTWAHDHLLNETSTVDLKRLAGWSSDAMLSRYGASGADVRAAATARRQARGDRV